MRLFKILVALTCVVGLAMTAAQSARLKDLASVQGVRSNQLVG